MGGVGAAAEVLKKFVRREIVNRELDFPALVLSDPYLLDMDQTLDGAPTWVVDLDIGDARPAKNVPIKAGSTGGRFYAQRGQTVIVRRTALGRMFVVAPGDRAVGLRTTTEYSLETGNAGTAVNEGFSRNRFPFEHYTGVEAMKGNPDLTFAASGNTITRSAGSFVTDGFGTGTAYVGRLSILNVGTVTISGVAATILTCSTSLFDEGPLSGVSLIMAGSSIWNDTVTGFPLSRLEDANGDPV